MSKVAALPSRVAAPPVQVLRPQSFDQLMQFANMAAKSQLVPKDYIGKPENVMLAVQMGSEIGLAPMQALQNIAVINGRPAVWGDAMLALCKASPVCDDVVERVDGEGANMKAVCVATRSGKEPVTVSFSMADAKLAGLSGKQGPWTQYPKRMLQMRARGFALRDAFPDVLKGLISAEEAQDIPDGQSQPAPRTETFKGTTIEAEPTAEAPKKPTVRGWLTALSAELDAATTIDTVFSIVSRSDVQSAFSKLTNGMLEELEMITDRADKRVRATEFPEVEDELVGDAQE